MLWLNARDKKVLTATRFTTPIIKVRIPPAMTICQKESPRDSRLVADLFRLPRIKIPRTIIEKASVTKPDARENRGQLREK